MSNLLDQDYINSIGLTEIPDNAKYCRILHHSKRMADIIWYDDKGKNLFPHPYLGEL